MNDAFPDLGGVDILWAEEPRRIASATHWATLRVHAAPGVSFTCDTFAEWTGEMFTIKLARTDMTLILRGVEVADDGTCADLIVGAVPAIPGDEVPRT